MQSANRSAVLIVNIAPNNHSKPLDVKKSVLDLKRIEGPFNQVDIAANIPFSLLQFRRRPRPLLR